MRALTWILRGYLAVVLAITLWPSPESTAAPGWAQTLVAALRAVGVPLTLAGAEAAANVILFLPLGLPATLLVALRSRSAGAPPASAPPAPRPPERAALVRAAGAVTLAGALLSIAIECAQRVIPGRVPTVQDVVLNTIGGALGAAVALLILALLQRRHTAAPVPAEAR